MPRELAPIACPVCAERQNVTPGGFDPERVPFGPVTCMVCRHAFTRDEYLQGLEESLAELERPFTLDQRPPS